MPRETADEFRARQSMEQNSFYQDLDKRKIEFLKGLEAERMDFEAGLKGLTFDQRREKRKTFMEEQKRRKKTGLDAFSNEDRQFRKKQQEEANKYFGLR